MIEPNLMVYESIERVFANTQSPLKLFRGTEAKIRNIGFQDGALYFATDTKKIYLDCKFNGSDDRLSFGGGGNSGIYYANKEWEVDDEQIMVSYQFTHEDIENYTEVPKIDDLILNEYDGSFYRITAVYDMSVGYNIAFTVEATRLTVSGSGGGGGGGGGSGEGGSTTKIKIVGGTVKYWSKEDDYMPLQFSMSIEDDPDIQIGYSVYVGADLIKRAEVSGLPQSTSDNPTVINLAPLKTYFADNSATRVVVVPMRDDGVEVSRRLQYTVTVFNLVLQPYSSSLQPVVGEYMDYFVRPYFGEGLTNVHINWRVVNINGVVMNTGTNGRQLTLQDSGSNVVCNVGQYPAGTYHIITQLEADITASGGAQQIYSNEVDQLCSWLDQVQDVPILSISFPNPPLDGYKQYDVIRIPYGVYFQEPTIQIRQYVLYTDENGVSTPAQIIDSKNITTGAIQDEPWVFQFNSPGTYRLRIVVGDGAVTETSPAYPVAGVGSNVPILQTDGLILNFTPEKSNSSVDKEIWANKGSAVDDNGDPVKAAFEHVNWQANGWARDANGTGVFRLNNGAKMTIQDYSPFATNAKITGRTIEFDVKISNIKDRQKRFITCLSENPNTKNIFVGVAVNGDFFSLNSSTRFPIKTWETSNYLDPDSGKLIQALTDNETGFTARYSEGERVHITYVITLQGSGLDGTMPRGFVYTYINGVISGLVNYESGENFVENATMPARFIFDSTYADIDIYNIRVYNIALEDRTVLTNYLATYGGVEESIQLYTENRLLDDITGTVSLEKVIQYGKIPYLVLRGGRQCNKNVTEFEGYGAEDEVDLPNGTNTDADNHDNGKKDFRFMEAYFYNPLTGFAIGDRDNRELVTVYCQGTSSIAYPVKNLRIKFWNRRCDADGYEGTDPVDKYTPLYKDGKAKKKKVKIYADQPAKVSVYTAKADYMDSSSSHNTGTCKMLPSIYGTNKTLAQRMPGKANTLTAIMGVPCVIFLKRYRHNTNSAETTTEAIRADVDIINNGIRPVNEAAENYSDYEYIGRYNLNLDKSEPDLFGFYSDPATHYGVRLETNDLYAAVGNDADISTKLMQLDISQNCFRALIDDDADLTYSSNLTYYQAPALDAEEWTPTLYDTNGQPLSQKELNSQLKTRLSFGPLYIHDTVAPNSIECWEFLTNNTVNDVTAATKDLPESQQEHYNIHFFQNPWSESYDTDFKVWTEAFESRYPEYPCEEASDKRGMARLINWIASTNAIKVGHEPTAEQLAAYKQNPASVPNNLVPLYPDQNNPTIPLYENDVPKGTKGILYIQNNGTLEGWTDTERNLDLPHASLVPGVLDNKQNKRETTFYYDSFEYRLHKFKSEFNDYMRQDYTLIYYLLTEFLVAKDSRAKNMMMVCYDSNPERNVGHWFPIFYDSDTVLGIDNVGKLRYRYDEEDSDPGVYNTNADYYGLDGVTPVKNYSVLWSNIRRTMYDELANMYRSMRGAFFNYTNLVNIYNTTQAEIWNETLTNQDVKYKFIRFITGYQKEYIYDEYPTSAVSTPETLYTATDGTSSGKYIYIVQGLQNLHHKQFIRRRMAYLDGKYGYLSGGVTVNNWRLQSAKNKATDDIGYTPLGIWDLTMGDSGYVLISPTQQTMMGPYRFSEGQEAIINTGTFDSVEQDFNFYFFNTLTDMHDLSGKRMANFPVNANANFTIRARNLDFTHNRSDYLSTFVNPNDAGSALTAIQFNAFPYLETVTTAYLPKLSSIDLSSNTYIKSVNAVGSPNLSTVTFPDGGILETVKLPRALTRLEIKGHPFLNDIEMENDDYSQIDEFYIEECPGIDTKAIFKKLQNYEYLTVKLPDINWTIHPDEVNVDQELHLLQTVDILDDLIIVNGPGQAARRGQNLVEGRNYVAGTIYFENDEEGQEYGVDENILYENYGKYYPNIRFEFVHNAYSQAAYTVKAFNASGTAAMLPQKISSSVLENLDLVEFLSSKLPVQSQVSDVKWEYEFVGWNFNEYLVVKEDGDEHWSLAVARDEAKANLVLKYNAQTGTYEQTDIPFTIDLFDPNSRELNLYPTFLGKVRYYTVTFHDSDIVAEAGVLGEPQLVRYGEAAIAPAVSPVKVEDDPTDISITTIRELDHYKPSYNMVIQNLDVYPVFSNIAKPASSYPAEAGAFNILGTVQENTESFASVLHGEQITGLKVEIKQDYPNSFITIPRELEYNENMVDVVEIVANRCSNLRKVYFQSGNHIKIIETGAFYSQSELVYVDLAACTELYRIGKETTSANPAADGPFALCSALRISGFPNNLMIIGHHAFYQSSADSPPLNFTALPEKLVKIGSNAFENCSNIQQIRMSEYLTDIPIRCFKGCTYLNFTEDYYFQNIVTIGRQAFQDCVTLSTWNAVNPDTQNYYVNRTVTSIGSSAFQNCVSLNMKTLPTSLKSIGDHAFYGCGDIILTQALLNPYLSGDQDMYAIGASAFGGCTLKNFTEQGSDGRLWIRVHSNYDRYDIAPDMFDDFTFSVLNLGEEIPDSQDLPVYNENNIVDIGGITIALNRTYYNTQESTDDYRAVSYFTTGRNNPWTALITHLEETGQIKRWKVKLNNGQYETRSNFHIQVVSN